MPYVTGQKEQEDGHTFTHYEGFADSTVKPFQYKTAQDVMRVINRGSSNITVNVNGSNTVIQAGRDATITGPLMQFTITAASGIQAFTADSWALAQPQTNRYKSTVMPTSGTYQKGDYVENVNPSVLGAAASKYVVQGWRRLVTGSAHVLNTDWAEDRGLTGA